jgi:hypothetical protein
MYLQPFSAMNGEELHTLRYITTFIYTTNDVSKGVFAASTEISFPTGSTIVVGNVASTESELANPIVDGGLLKGIRRLFLHKDRLDNLFHILTPKLRAFFFCLVKGNLLGHANNLHIMQLNNLVFHMSFFCLTLQNYEELRIPPKIWDILSEKVMNGNQSSVAGGTCRRHTTERHTI